MSKRLGRNQKNAWRKRVAELELENQHLRVALKTMGRFHDDAVAETKRIAGEIQAVASESAILPAKQRTADLPVYRRLVVPQRRFIQVLPTRTRAKESTHGGLEFHEEPVAFDPEDMTIETVTVELHEVRAVCEKHASTLRRIVHLRAGPRAAAYAVSEETLRMGRRLGLVRRQIERDVAEALMDALGRIEP